MEIYTYMPIILVLVFISCLVVNKFSYRQMLYDFFILQHVSVHLHLRIKAVALSCNVAFQLFHWYACNGPLNHLCRTDQLNRPEQLTLLIWVSPCLVTCVVTQSVFINSLDFVYLKRCFPTHPTIFFLLLITSSFMFYLVFLCAFIF